MRMTLEPTMCRASINLSELSLANGQQKSVSVERIRWGYLINTGQALGSSYPVP